MDLIKKEIKIYVFGLVTLVVDNKDGVDGALSSSKSLGVSMDSESSINISVGFSDDVVQVVGVLTLQNNLDSLKRGCSTVEDSGSLDGSGGDAGIHRSLDAEQSEKEKSQNDLHLKLKNRN